MQTRLFGTLVAVLSALAIVQVSQTLITKPTPAKLVDVRKGTQISYLVGTGMQDTPTALSDVGRGSCSYVIIYSPTCGASANAAREWNRDVLDDPDHQAVPEGWKTFWVSVADSAASAAFFPKGFPVPAYYAREAGDLASTLGIRAYPARLILDREGRILSGHVGAPLPTKDRFRADCTIGASERTLTLENGK